MQNRNHILIARCLYSLALFYTFRTSDAYCWEPGKNPYFTAAPRVEQVSISKVRLSWKGIVGQRKCVDAFLVKYWHSSMPSGFQLTDLVKPDINFIEIEVVPKVPYNFEVVAREDKGPLLGVDWNKSAMVQFRTSRLNQLVEEVPEPEVDLSTRHAYVPPPTTISPLTERGQPGLVFQGVTVELMAIIIVSSFIVLLILVGLVYKCFQTKSVDSSDDDVEENAVDKDSDREDFDADETDNLKARYRRSDSEL